MGAPEPPTKGFLPLLPLRNTALFPGTVLPVDLGRTLSVEAVRHASELPRDDPQHNLVVVATQRDPMTERPRRDELHGTAVVGHISQVLHGLPGRMTVFVRGLRRVRLIELERNGQYEVGSFEAIEENEGVPKLASALAGALQELAKKHDGMLPSKLQSPQRQQSLQECLEARNPSLAADMIAAHVDLKSEERIEMLQELDVVHRLRRMLEYLSRLIQENEVKRDIDRSVREHLSRHEHEAMLRHKMRAIEAELERDEPEERWLAELTERIRELDLPEEAQAAAERELGRLERMNPQSGEAQIARSYLEWIADLPWDHRETPPDQIDLDLARERLEQAHHGLDKVKKRVIEYLSVRKLAPKQRGPILCLVGPPGVGKTSLASSIAETLGRRMVRISLGGVKDDAEIRGHRRTYVGARPGRFIFSMKKAGTTNPVLLLDEVDKLTGSDLRGDPASALLEALDPEQNDAFEDHYLGVPYDLSKVVFICTANDLGGIPQVLRDRLEIIHLSGYTLDEKLEIARGYLLPREQKENGLEKLPLHIEDEAIMSLAVEHTRESGVRELQRKLAALLRDVAMRLAENKRGSKSRGEQRESDSPIRIDAAEVSRILGPPRYREELMGRRSRPGVATGLGWTPTGGRLLFVEATIVPGSGRLRLTGSLGDVMKESGQTASSLVRSNAERFGLPSDFMQDTDIHIHLPAGAIPKDGPSAGIALSSVVISALSGRPIRHDVAMTGEVTLRGNVLPVGGIREKVLAAHRAGIRDVILPDRNRKDEVDIPEKARQDLRIHYVKTIDEVLELILLDPERDELSA